MSFTRSTTNTDVIRQLPDYPTSEGITASQLKEKFDSAGEGLKGDFNGFLDELEASTSAADIGAAAVTEGDTSESNVQAKLEYLQSEVEEAVLGQIPDNTITKAKLTDEFSATIPTNADLGKLYLATQYRTPNIASNPTPTSYTVPALTTSDKQGYTLSTSHSPEDCGSENISDLYTMFNGNGSGEIWIARTAATTKFWQLVLACPLAIRLTKMTVGAVNAKITLYGSKDNTTWVNLGNAASSGGSITINVSDTNYYTYFKIVFNKVSSSDKGNIDNNIILQGYSVSSLDVNTMTITATEDNELLSDYVTGQIVKITTPSDYLAGGTFNSTLNIYSLGAKSVPTDLQPSTRYSLVYDGTKFVKE